MLSCRTGPAVLANVEIAPISAASMGWILTALGKVKIANVVLLYFMTVSSVWGKDCGT